MSLQSSSGTIINTMLTQSAGTRAELVDWINTELQAAGWTSNTNSSHNYTLTSASTPVISPHSALNMKINVLDPGSGNCAQLFAQNVAGTKVQAGRLYLLPAVGKIWQIIASKYQAFVFTPGVSAAREFVAFGVPYIPTLQTAVTECIWACGNSYTDTDANTRGTFRNAMQMAAGPNGNANWFGLVNGSVSDSFGSSATTTNQTGGMQIATAGMQAGVLNAPTAYRFFDGSMAIGDPWIAWQSGLGSGSGTGAATSDATVMGQLWDAIVLSDSFTADTVIAGPSSKNFQCITSSNNGGSTFSTPRGTLAVALT